MTETERVKMLLHVAKCQVAKGALQSRKSSIRRMKNLSVKQKSGARKILGK